MVSNSSRWMCGLFHTSASARAEISSPARATTRRSSS
jgi:hypothetical protein